MFYLYIINYTYGLWHITVHINQYTNELQQTPCNLYDFVSQTLFWSFLKKERFGVFPFVEGAWHAIILGSNMVSHALTFAKSVGRYCKSRPEAAVFNISLGTWRMVMHWKPMFDRYYCITTVNICYISRYFLHYFVSPFHRCLANAISKDYARSRAGQYISRNGSKSVAPLRSYWKLRSHALTARELPC